MNREPIGLYLFRFVVGLGIIAFMAMLYWSSLLLEEDMKSLRTQMEQLNNELLNLQNSFEKVRLAPANSHAENGTGNLPSLRPHIDSSLPNLLQEDPFYAVVLPKLLGANFKPWGTFQTAIVGKPHNLHPFTDWLNVANWLQQCTVSVARLKFGIYETFAPDMAFKVEERKDKDTGKVEYWVHLRENVYWQPLRREWFSEDIKLSNDFLKKHPVTADDFKFYFDAMMNPFVQEPGAVALRTYFGDIEELRVIDPLTFTVRWKTEEVKQPDGTTVLKTKYKAKQLTGSLRPLARFVYQHFPDGKKIIEDDESPDTYRKNSVWAQQFSQHWAKNIIISCGGWVFDGMTDRQIKFRRNTNHYFPLDVLALNEEVQFKESPDNIWEEFKINRLDSYDLRPDQILELERFLQTPEYEAQSKKGASIKRLDYVSRAYTYVGWNEARVFFGSKKVRQALTMAIDRKRIIRQTLNGMGIETNGTFYRYSPSYDESIIPWPYNPEQARRLLEEEGWYDSTGSGVIDKEIDGKRVPFRFKLMYYVKNPLIKNICEYICTALKEIQVDCVLHGVDLADLSANLDGKNFDAYALSWSLGTPPEEPRQLWHSSGAKESGSSNFIGFANAQVDAIIDALDYESDPAKRIKLYHRFDAIIHDEAPYTFLYTPKMALIYREYLQNVFIPAERQDLVPGANIAQPESSAYWLKAH